MSFLFFTIPYNSFTGTSIVVDLNTRINSNDAYFSSYYFCWTSTTYLAAFSWLSLLFIVLTYSLQCIEYQCFVILSIGLILLTEMIDFSFLNYGWDQSNYSKSGLNNLLTNSLNCYHPLILYLSFFLLTLTGAFYEYQVFNEFYFSQSRYNQTIECLGGLFTLTNLLALFMGSWWALQEGTWGGWWNWDTSEVLGWLITLYFLLYLHSATRTFASTLLWYKQLVMWEGNQ